MVDFDATAKWLRTRTDTQLVAIANLPAAVIGRLPGFTKDDLGTASELMIGCLAEMERKSRDARKTRRILWFSLAVSVLSLVIAGLSLAWTVTRLPPARDEVPAISTPAAPSAASPPSAPVSPQSAPSEPTAASSPSAPAAASPQKLLPGTKFQQR
jgi:hypothetical protein